MIEQCVFVLALHGAGGTGQAMDQTLASVPASWQVVSPSSPTMLWNLRPSSSDEKWLVRVARKSNCDTKVVTGFSNGGYMASALLCRHPRLFDGAFSVNGFTSAPTCKVNKNSHAVVISGQNDPLVNKSGVVHESVYHIIPEWARVPAKSSVKSMSITSGTHTKTKVTVNKNYKVYSWGNFKWALEYNASHEWTTNTTQLFINFVEGVKK